MGVAVSVSQLLSWNYHIIITKRWVTLNQFAYWNGNLLNSNDLFANFPKNQHRYPIHPNVQMFKSFGRKLMPYSHDNKIFSFLNLQTNIAVEFLVFAFLKISFLWIKSHKKKYCEARENWVKIGEGSESWQK